SGDHLPGEDLLHRESLAYQTRQTLRAAVTRDNSEFDLGLADFGVFASETHGAGQGDLAAAAESEAVNAGDHRLPEIFDQVQDGLTFVGVLLAANCIVLGQFRYVRTRDESLLARPGEDHD